MNLLKDERVKTIALIGGLLGFVGLLINVARSKPVASAIVSLKTKAGI